MYYLYFLQSHEATRKPSKCFFSQILFHGAVLTDDLVIQLCFHSFELKVLNPAIAHATI